MGWGQDWGTALYGDPGDPLLDYIEGFEHQTLSVLQIGGNGVGLFDTLANSAGMSFVAGRTGSALHIDDSNAAVGTAATRYVPLALQRVFSGYFRLAAAPSVASFIWTIYDDAGSQMARVRVETDGTMTFGCVDGTGRAYAVNVCDNDWHLVDLWLDSSCATSDTWVLHWAVDDAAGTNATSATGKTATETRRLTYGSNTAAHTAVVDWDDCIASASGGVYPIGEHHVGYSVPTSDGTHNAGTNTVEANSGVDIGATTAYTLLDEWPANSVDYVRQVANSTTNYAEVNFADTSDVTVWGVEAIVALFASSGTTNNGITRIVDTAGATLIDVYSGDQSQTSVHHRTIIVPVPSGGWTPTLLNDLKGRVGFSSSTTSRPYWTALMIQYAVPEANPQSLDAPLISSTRAVFTPSMLLHPRATVALISRVGVLFLPRLNQKMTVGLISRVGTPFAPSKFNQKIGSLSGVFQDNVFQDGVFQEASGLFINRTPTLFAPTFPATATTVTIGKITQTGVTKTPALTGQAVAGQVLLTGTGGWDSGEITWDDTDTDWDAAGLGGQINQTGHVFAPTIPAKVTVGFITHVPVLFAPSVAAKQINLGFINRAGFTYTPQQVKPSVTLGLIQQVGVVLTPVVSIPAGVTVGLIASTVTLYAFQLNPQTIDFEFAFISNAGHTYTPQQFTFKVTLGLISSTVSVFAPKLDAIALDLISQAGVTFDPALVFNPDDVVVGLIASTVEVFEPVRTNVPFQQTIRLDETAQQFIDNAGTVFEFAELQVGQPQDIFIATIHQEGTAIAPRIYRASFVIPRAQKIATYQPILRLCSTYDPILRKEASTLGVKSPITKADAWFVGEDQVFEYLSLTAGLPDNITGWTIQFRMATDDGEPSLLTIAAVLTDPTHGVFQIVTSSASTVGLEPDVYYYDVSRLDAGSNQVLAFGPAHLQARVT